MKNLEQRLIKLLFTSYYFHFFSIKFEADSFYKKEDKNVAIIILNLGVCFTHCYFFSLFILKVYN